MKGTIDEKVAIQASRLGVGKVWFGPSPTSSFLYLLRSKYLGCLDRFQLSIFDGTVTSMHICSEWTNADYRSSFGGLPRTTARSLGGLRQTIARSYVDYHGPPPVLQQDIGGLPLFRRQTSAPADDPHHKGFKFYCLRNSSPSAK